MDWRKWVDYLNKMGDYCGRNVLIKLRVKITAF